MFRGLRLGQSLAGHTRRGVPLKCLINATLAQLEEQLICNHQVVGSTPTGGSTKIVTFGIPRVYEAGKRKGKTLRSSSDIKGRSIGDKSHYRRKKGGGGRGPNKVGRRARAKIRRRVGKALCRAI